MVTKKQELSREDIIRSFDTLADDATAEDFIDHLANVLGIEDSRSGSPTKGALLIPAYRTACENNS